MPLFLITGLPGSGKTTVRDELISRGFKAYDGDQDDLAEWYNIDTGVPIEQSDRERTAEFGRTHSRDIIRQKVDELAALAIDKSVFLCADPENEDELSDLFAKMFALVIDEDVRRVRLASRTNNNWGKLPHEIERDQIFRQKLNKSIEGHDYIIVDAALMPGEVVDIILKETDGCTGE
jgi:adenylate kinase family enzyme